jgi:hypothetical protein
MQLIDLEINYLDHFDFLDKKRIEEELQKVLNQTIEERVNKIDPNINPDIDIKKSKKEISDAILEVVEKTKKDLDIESNIERELQIYAALEKDKKGLDYSTLNYGNIAKPLAIEWDYGDYEPDTQGFRSQETISMKEVEEIVEEKAFGDLFHKGEAFLRAKTDYAFQYWKLFNGALNIMKYEWAFT